MEIETELVVHKIKADNLFFGFVILPILPSIIYFLDWIFWGGAVRKIAATFFEASGEVGFRIGNGSLPDDYQCVSLFLTLLAIPLFVVFWYFYGSSGVRSGRITAGLLLKQVLSLFFLISIFLIMCFLYVDIDESSGRRLRSLLLVFDNPILFHFFVLLPMHFFSLYFSTILKLSFNYIKGEF